MVLVHRIEEEATEPLPIQVETVRLRVLTAQGRMALFALQLLNDEDIIHADMSNLLDPWVVANLTLPGTYVLVEKDSGEPAGVCSFGRSRRDPHWLEASYAMHPAFRGRGLMVEALRKLVACHLEWTDAHGVFASIDEPNAASRGVALSAGFQKLPIQDAAVPLREIYGIRR